MVGLSPKRLARIARFQHALAMLEEAEGRGCGARTAVACGYADQAHFIRDFTTLAGCAPGEHLLRRGEMTGFFTAGVTPQPD
jgi:AraC-like DNA-binding protein